MLRKINRNSLKTSWQLLLVIAAALLVWGCGGGSDSYDEPSATKTAPLAGQTQSVLINAATLKGWVDSGLVNNENSWEKVVILDVGDATDYNTGHIPGAQLWTVSGSERYEGPVLSGNMVIDGPTMDAALQLYGIDENTTVVFAGKSNPSRVYFMFRYWGFTKNRLKILSGNKKAWTDAGYALSTQIPAVTPSTYCVNSLQFNPDVRAALNELIIAAENGTAVPLNSLTNNTEQAGKTSGILADVGGDFVIFQGSIQGGAHLTNGAYYNADGTVKTVAEIKALLEGVGVDGSKPIITYCRAGNAASYAFMPIDAALGWDVMVYDGSWSQWGSLTNETGAAFVPDASYALPALLSEWDTDDLIEWHTLANDDYLDPTKHIAGPYYNINFPKVIEKPVFKSVTDLTLENALSPYAPGANSIEIEDREYFEIPPAGAPTSGSGGSGGGC
jgi:3-mercaptopyruvate sulfurtransferase SseA